MMIELSDQASDAILNALADLLDGGRIELLETNGRALAILRLSDPATVPAASRELEFREIIEDDSASATGIVTTARIVGSSGFEVFSCDVGDENSDAVIKLNTTKIYRGGPVRLSSFRLAMP